MKTAILVNCSAGNRQAVKKWNLVKEEVLSGLPADTIVIVYDIPFNLRGCIRMLMQEQGVGCFISAGGDGSINLLLNAIMELKPAGRQVCLGGVGLGSSNDFLKPVKTMIRGIPVKANPGHMVPADVGKATFIGDKEEKATRYFIVNAGIGVTAEANMLFNTGDFLLDRLKSGSVKAAILYAALKTMGTYRNRDMQVEYGGVVRRMNITNISVIKNPNISGSFCYDQDIQPGDGFLGLNICHGMNKFELASTLVDLTNGRFSGKRKRISELVKSCRLDAGEWLALETDGEVMMAKNIEFSILPGAISIAGT